MKLILPDRTIRVSGSSSPVPARTLLEQEGINPLEVMVIRNGILVSEEAGISGDDEVRVIRISHGG